MLSKFFDRFCFTTIFLVLVVLFLLGSQLLNVFKRSKGGEMTESNHILPQTVGAWTRPASPKVITPENIFDYMDGAGELYLGYRFDRCDVYEYKAENRKEILVELYFMESSDDAFGLLSLDWGGEPVDLKTSAQKERGTSKEVSGEPGWPLALYGEGLLRLRSDSIYARVMAARETPESGQAVLSLGRSIVRGRPESAPPGLVEEIPLSFLPEWILLKERVRYFRSHLVLNSLYYLSHENILDLGLDCEAVTAPYQAQNSNVGQIRFRYLTVNYPDRQRAENALIHFRRAYLPDHPLHASSVTSGKRLDVLSIEDGWLAYRWQGKSLVFLFECPDRETAEALIGQIE